MLSYLPKVTQIESDEVRNHNKNINKLYGSRTQVHDQQAMLFVGMQGTELCLIMAL